jgi:hypothetical protein
LTSSQLPTFTTPFPPYHPQTLTSAMSTRKRKNEDEELVALPSDEEESEEE